MFPLQSKLFDVVLESPRSRLFLVNEKVCFSSILGFSSNQTEKEHYYMGNEFYRQQSSEIKTIQLKFLRISLVVRLSSLVKNRVY